jgi:glycosyltransferase involved in cell wall biosynthesis
MKILVFAHQLEVGGTQVNAIELTAALRDFHGHDVAVFATPGPMVELVRQKGLRFLPAPEARVHPSPVRMRALREAVRQERPDVIHVWDWWQCLDAYFGVHLPMRMPILVTDMCMSISRLLPKMLPTTFGIPDLVDDARAQGRRRVELLLPPVDIRSNAPGAADPRPFRAQHAVNDEDILLVTVSRFAESLKGDSLRQTIAAVRTLGRQLPLRLLLVGDGTLRPELQRQADRANAELGRPAITLTGALLDPRPAYAAADLFIGMGGSALRAMAFARPVVIAGERGFAAPFNPSTAEFFYRTGIYGIGDGNGANAELTTIIRELAERADLLPALGEFSRQFAVRHFSLEAVSAKLSDLCQAAASETVNLRVAIADGIRTMAVWLRERRFVPGQRAFVADVEAWSTPTDATTGSFSA